MTQHYVIFKSPISSLWWVRNKTGPKGCFTSLAQALYSLPVNDGKPGNAIIDMPGCLVIAIDTKEKIQ